MKWEDKESRIFHVEKIFAYLETQYNTSAYYMGSTGNH